MSEKAGWVSVLMFINYTELGRYFQVKCIYVIFNTLRIVQFIF